MKDYFLVLEDAFECLSCASQDLQKYPTLNVLLMDHPWDQGKEPNIL
jgi:hypothetical protein